MRKPNPKKQPNAGRIAQNTHKLPAELIQLAVEYLELPRYPAGHPNAGKRIGVSALEVKHKVAPGYISRSKLIERLKQLKPTDAPLLSTFEKREPKAWTPDTVELMERQAEEWGWRFSDREMADFLSDNGVDVSHVGVWRYRQENEWTEKRSQVVPWLSTGENCHRGQRQEFAAELTDETWDAWVDGDEKWFYGLRLHEILKLPPGVEAPPPPANQIQAVLTEGHALVCRWQPTLRSARRWPENGFVQWQGRHMASDRDNEGEEEESKTRPRGR